MSKHGISVAVILITYGLNYLGIDPGEGSVLQWVEAVALVLAGLGLVWHQWMERNDVKWFIFK